MKHFRKMVVKKINTLFSVTGALLYCSMQVKSLETRIVLQAIECQTSVNLYHVAAMVRIKSFVFEHLNSFASFSLRSDVKNVLLLYTIAIS